MTYHEQLARAFCNAITYAVRTGTPLDTLAPAVEVMAAAMAAVEVDR